MKVDEQIADFAKALQQPLRCPHCEAELSMEFVASVPKETRLSFTIGVKEGERVNAATLGGVITSFGELLQAVGESFDTSLVALIDSIETLGDGALQINFLVVQAASRKARKKAA
jgi:hypothetical protein